MFSAAVAKAVLSQPPAAAIKQSDERADESARPQTPASAPVHQESKTTDTSYILTDLTNYTPVMNITAATTELRMLKSASTPPSTDTPKMSATATTSPYAHNRFTHEVDRFRNLTYSEKADYASMTHRDAEGPVLQTEAGGRHPIVKSTISEHMTTQHANVNSKLQHLHAFTHSNLNELPVPSVRTPGPRAAALAAMATIDAALAKTASIVRTAFNQPTALSQALNGTPPRILGPEERSFMSTGGMNSSAMWESSTGRANDSTMLGSHVNATWQHGKHTIPQQNMRIHVANANVSPHRYSPTTASRVERMHQTSTRLQPRVPHSAVEESIAAAKSAAAEAEARIRRQQGQHSFAHDGTTSGHRSQQHSFVHDASTARTNKSTLSARAPATMFHPTATQHHSTISASSCFSPTRMVPLDKPAPKILARAAHLEKRTEQVPPVQAAKVSSGVARKADSKLRDEVSVVIPLRPTGTSPRSLSAARSDDLGRVKLWRISARQTQFEETNGTRDYDTWKAVKNPDELRRLIHPRPLQPEKISPTNAEPPKPIVRQANPARPPAVPPRNDGRLAEPSLRTIETKQSRVPSVAMKVESPENIAMSVPPRAAVATTSSTRSSTPRNSSTKSSTPRNSRPATPSSRGMPRLAQVHSNHERTLLNMSTRSSVSSATVPDRDWVLQVLDTEAAPAPIAGAGDIQWFAPMPAAASAPRTPKQPTAYARSGVTEDEVTAGLRALEAEASSPSLLFTQTAAKF